MRIYIYVVISIIIGFVSSWTIFFLIYTPGDDEYMKTTTSFYFKKMSELDLNGFNYYDCSVEEPDQQYSKMGIAKVGICTLKTGKKDTTLEVTMSSTASIISFDLQEIINAR